MERFKYVVDKLISISPFFVGLAAGYLLRTPIGLIIDLVAGVLRIF